MVRSAAPFARFGPLSPHGEASRVSNYEGGLALGYLILRDASNSRQVPTVVNALVLVNGFIRSGSAAAGGELRMR